MMNKNIVGSFWEVFSDVLDAYTLEVRASLLTLGSRERQYFVQFLIIDMSHFIVCQSGFLPVARSEDQMKVSTLLILIFALFGCASTQGKAKGGNVYNEAQATESSLAHAAEPLDPPELDEEATIEAMKTIANDPDAEGDEDMPENAFCITEYDVQQDGSTTNHRVVRCSDDRFASTAVEMAKRLRYRPTFKGSEPVERENIRYKFSFNRASR